MKGVDFIVQYLAKNMGVSHVFTYAGGTNAWLLDALKRNNIAFIPSRHEEHAAFAADGYARASGKLGVALAMSGPGATNLITGIADAYFDSVPVLFLTGQVTTSTYKFNKPVRQLGYQETDIVSIVKPITKYADMAINEKQMVDMLKTSISVALSGRPGPVLFDIPSDVQRKDVDSKELMFFPNVEDNPKIDDIQIDEFIDIIKGSKRPIILAGGGIRSSSTVEHLKRFVERFQIPVVVSLMGKDSFPNNHPLFVGFIGSYGNRYANFTLANSDLVIALGSRLDSRQTANPKTFARAAKKIHVDIDKNELNSTLNCDLSIHAHLRDFFDKVDKVFYSPDLSRYQDWYKYIKEIKNEFKVDGIGNKKFVNPKELLHCLSDYSFGNEIFLADVGNNQMWSAQELVIKEGQRFLTSGGLGSMGFAVPASVGASFACPDRVCVAIVGDGGFQMSLSEIQTIAHNDIPVKIIVFNNSILGLMWHFQNENFSGGHPATEEGYSCPNIKKISHAFGIQFKNVSKNSNVSSAIKWLFSNKHPAILEVVVDRSWAGYPKVKPGNPLESQLPEIPVERSRKYMLIPEFKKPV